MSASKEKKIRQELYASGKLDKNPEQTKQIAHRKKTHTVLTIVCIVLVVVLAAGSVYGSAVFEKNTTAVTVGSHKVSPAMYNYFYRSIYSNILSQYGQLASYLIDQTKSLDSQYYDQEKKQTWEDFLKEQTNTSLAQAYAVYDDAVKNGFKLSDTEEATLTSLPETIESYATSNGYASAADFLKTTYGRGCTVKNYAEYARLTQTVSSYTQQYSDALKYSDDDVETYYQSHKDTYDTVSYHAYLCAVKTGTGDDATVDMDASKQLAESIATGGYQNLDKYNELVAANVSTDQQSSYTDGSATLNSDRTKANVSEGLADWLFDTTRKAGDTAALVSGTSGYYAVYYVDNSSKNDVKMVNVRHILIKPTDSNDDASKEAAKTKAQGLLDQFNAGDKTEDAFAALAKANSEDTGSASNGGLYENVYPGEMETAFSDWCFDSSRQVGDTGLVETSYGYHVMYFSGWGENYRIYKIRNDMKTEATNTWAENLGKALTTKVSSFGMSFASTKKASTSTSSSGTSTTTAS